MELITPVKSFSDPLCVLVRPGLHGQVDMNAWGGIYQPGEYPETLYHRDGALLYIAYVRLIWAAPIPADRWHCSLWP